MNILIIPSWYPNEDEPLSGSFFKEQAIALASLGHRVVVLNASFQDRKHVRSSLNYKVRVLQYEKVIEYAYNVPALGVWRMPKICSRLFSHNISKLWKCVENKKFDIIHVHSYYPAGMAACDLSKKTNIPVVYTEHVSGVMFKNLPKEHERQLKNLALFSKRIISVSQNLKYAIGEYVNTNNEIKVIPNLIDPSLFKYKQNNKKDIYIYLTVGILDDNKRMDWIIKAFYELTRTNDNILLQIIGEGSQKNYLTSLVHELNIDEMVSFEGKCSRERVAQMMQDADCFVLDSKVETFGVVYIEAMACGLPIVIPKWNSSNIEILDNNYVLIEEDTIESLAEAMNKVYNQRNEFDSYLISQKCVEYYSGSNIARQITNVYNELLREERMRYDK